MLIALLEAATSDAPPPSLRAAPARIWPGSAF